MAAMGTGQVDFGPNGSSSPTATVNVTGQGAIAATDLAEAWVRPQAATADHSVDEHIVENIKFVAGPITAGAGFQVTAVCTFGSIWGKFDFNWAWGTP
jgi:hypothetical protein